MPSGIHISFSLVLSSSKTSKYHELILICAVKPHDQPDVKAMANRLVSPRRKAQPTVSVLRVYCRQQMQPLIQMEIAVWSTTIMEPSGLINEGVKICSQGGVLSKAGRQEERLHLSEEISTACCGVILHAYLYDKTDGTALLSASSLEGSTATFECRLLRLRGLLLCNMNTRCSRKVYNIIVAPYSHLSDGISPPRSQGVDFCPCPATDLLLCRRS